MFSYCTLHDKDIIEIILAIRVIVWSQVGIEEHSAWDLMQSDETACVGPVWNQLDLNLSFQALIMQLIERWKSFIQKELRSIFDEGCSSVRSALVIVSKHLLVCSRSNRSAFYFYRATSVGLSRTHLLCTCINIKGHSLCVDNVRTLHKILFT